MSCFLRILVSAIFDDVCRYMRRCLKNQNPYQLLLTGVYWLGEGRSRLRTNNSSCPEWSVCNESSLPRPSNQLGLMEATFVSLQVGRFSTAARQRGTERSQTRWWRKGGFELPVPLSRNGPPAAPAGSPCSNRRDRADAAVVLTPKVGPAVRIRFPPAASLQTLGPLREIRVTQQLEAGTCRAASIR